MYRSGGHVGPSQQPAICTRICTTTCACVNASYRSGKARPVARNAPRHTPSRLLGCAGSELDPPPGGGARVAHGRPGARCHVGLRARKRPPNTPTAHTTTRGAHAIGTHVAPAVRPRTPAGTGPWGGGLSRQRVAYNNICCKRRALPRGSEDPPLHEAAPRQRRGAAR